MVTGIVNRVLTSNNGRKETNDNNIHSSCFFFASDVIICYQCCKKIPQGQYRIDRGFQNDMQTLEIICAFCDWTGILKNYQVRFFSSIGFVEQQR